MDTRAQVTNQSFDPQTGGFTFPNYWTLDQVTCEEVRRRLEAAIHGAFKFLPPVPGIASLRDKARSSLEQWVQDASIPAYGLCGGMTFAALDYYKAGLAIPDRSQESDQISPELQRYILKRMIDSLAGPNLARVLGWMVVEQYVPRGGGKRLLMQWTATECDKLKTLIDQNGGWPIALIGESKDPCHNHQVLAYRCEPREGQGDIYVYDVNYPGPGRKFHLDLHGPALELGEDGHNDAWKPLRGLFCEDYAPAKPQLSAKAASPLQPAP